MNDDLAMKRDGAALAWAWFDRWPDPLSLEKFAADILRLSGARTGEEKAVALYRWVNRVFRWGPAYHEWTSIGWTNDDDLIKTLAVFGCHYCDGWGRLTSALWNAGRMGAPAEKLVVWVPSGVVGHTMTELTYEDADGVERPHAFDVFHQVAARTRDGKRFASFEDIMADKSLWIEPTDPLIPWYYRPSQRETKHNARYTVPSYGLLLAPRHDLRHRLRPGTEVTRYYEPCFPPYRVRPSAGSPKEGECRYLHDSEDIYLPDGSPRDPENEPYFRAYARKCDWPGCRLHGKTLRFYGSGEMIVRPPLSVDAGLAASSSHELLWAGAEDGRLVQRRDRQLACYVLPVECPYILTGGTLSFSWMKADPLDYVGLGLSPDGGTGWNNIWSAPLEKADRPVRVELPMGLEEFLAGKPSVYGRYRLYFRFEILSHGPKTNCCFSDIVFRGTFMHNDAVSPRLLPGRNRFVLSGGSAGIPVRMELEWEECGAAKSAAFQSSAHEISENIFVGGRNPWDVRMRRLALKA
ncbi:MAG: hypothetical protein N3A38_03670 [Planctomycetota bacterium]|nr:hypothetical protein [Planctomycetota bacterium]